MIEFAIRRYATYNKLNQAEPLRGCACSFASQACGFSRSSQVPLISLTVMCFRADCVKWRMYVRS